MNILELYLRERRNELSPSTVGMTETFFAELANFNFDVKLWRNSMIEAGLSKNSANSKVKTVRPVFNWAEREGLVSINPFKGLKLFKVAQQRIRVYTNDEVTAMCEVADLRWRGMIMIARTSGLRRGEILNLQISDVDFDRKEVHVAAKKPTVISWPWRTKNFQRRTVPLADTAVQLLAYRIEELQEGQPYIFLTAKRYRTVLQLHLAGTLKYRVQQTPEENFSTPFNRIRRRAGVADGDFHDLRKTCCTYLLQHLPLHEVMVLMGHKSIETTKTFYAGLTPDARDRARRAVNAGLATKTPSQARYQTALRPENADFAVSQFSGLL